MFKFVILLVIFQLAYIFCNPVVYEDAESAATDHDHHHHDHHRVQIKVFRGPTEHGHGHHDFAPWGFWVKQPHDEHHHH